MSTSVVNINYSEYDVLITRQSKWGNPYSHKKGTLANYIVASRKEAIAAYKEWITVGDGKHLLNDLHELKNKRLGCVCKIDKYNKGCHGDVLVELVNEKFGTKIKGLFK
jgi:hypothetical protein